MVLYFVMVNIVIFPYLRITSVSPAMLDEYTFELFPNIFLSLPPFFGVKHSQLHKIIIIALKKMTMGSSDAKQLNLQFSILVVFPLHHSLCLTLSITFVHIKCLPLVFASKKNIPHGTINLKPENIVTPPQGQKLQSS